MTADDMAHICGSIKQIIGANLRRPSTLKPRTSAEVVDLAQP
jgi:hypothetical protein